MWAVQFVHTKVTPKGGISFATHEFKQHHASMYEQTYSKPRISVCWCILYCVLNNNTMALLLCWTHHSIWPRRFQLIRLVTCISFISLYFHGLLLSNGAINLTTSIIPQTSKMKSFHEQENTPIEVLRSLPHLRVINTLHRYQYNEQKKIQSGIGGSTDTNLFPREKRVDLSSNQNHKIPSVLVQSKPNITDIHIPKTEGNGSDFSHSEFSIFGSFLSLVAFALSCRIILAILIYLHSNQSFELYFNEMGQIRRRRIINPQGRSFLSIFRTIPIRTRQRPGSLPSRQTQFIALATRLNEQRVANGARPLNIQSLSLLFSNRDFSGTDYESLWEVQEQNENNTRRSGASDEEINRCPMRTLIAGDDLIVDSHIEDPSNASLGERTKCAICLENYKVDEIIRTLPCFHIYHVGCVDRWLGSKSLCPICKHSVIV